MAELLGLGSCKSGALQEYCRFITFLSFLRPPLPLRLPGVHLAGEMELFFPLFDFLVTGELSFQLSLLLSDVRTLALTHVLQDP